MKSVLIFYFVQLQHICPPKTDITKSFELPSTNQTQIEQQYHQKSEANHTMVNILQKCGHPSERKQKGVRKKIEL